MAAAREDASSPWGDQRDVPKGNPMNTMRKTAAALAAAVLISTCASAAPAPLDRSVRLEWRFVANKPFYQKTVSETSQKVTVSGNEVAITQKHTLLYRWTPVRRLADGSWLVKQKVQSLQFDLDMGGSKITYDSTKGGENPLADFFKSWLDTELTLTISPHRTITRVEGHKALLEKAAKADPQTKGLLESMLSENALKETARTLFGGLPGKPVKPGDRWVKESKTELPGMGGYLHRTQYVFEGPDADKKLARVAVTDKLKHIAADSTKGGELPFKVAGSEFKKAEATGTIWINLSKGRTERSQMTMRLSGRMTIEIGGQKTDIDIDQTNKTTMTISDVSPGAENKAKR
jgi:hypothetical protein